VRPRYLLIVVPRGGMYEGLDAGGGPGAPTAGVGEAGVVDGRNGAGAENTRPPETSAARSSCSPAPAVPAAGRGR
jgi:hypothetical protein